MNNHENFGNQSGDYIEYNNDFEPFNPERAREEQERRKFDQLVVNSAQKLTEDAKNKLLSRGVFAGEDPLQFYYDLRKSELISDAKIADYIKSVKTPAEALRDGYHGLDSGQDAWSMACNAQFNLSFSKMDETTMMHSKRILEMFSGGDFNKPNNADGNSYKAFLQRYPSALDFDVDSEAFLSKIGLVGEPLNSEGSKAKRAEYVRDMAAFKKAMYGEQQSRLDAVKYLNTLSNQYGRLTQDVRMFNEIKIRTKNESEVMADGEGSEGDILSQDSSQMKPNSEDDSVAGESVMNEPSIGDDLGNGYRCASVGGWDNKSDAYEARVSEDVVFYEPTKKWYLAVR